MIKDSNIEIRKILGLKLLVLQPFNYERYKNYNSKLSLKMYKYLRENHSEWKILCGLRTEIKWSNEILESVWWIENNGNYKESVFYKNRFSPEKYLRLSW